jgi:hypothetical protein
MPRHTSPQADNTQTNLALRRIMRIENGRVSRNPATQRIDNEKVRIPRQPSMPKMPWDEKGATLKLK